MVTIKEPTPGRNPQQIIDRAAVQARRDPAATEVAGIKAEAAQRAPVAVLRDPLKADFRNFLTLIWRFLLKVDPSPIQLDMAYWLQYGPSRSVIMAFRGFSKSWITGAYALWRLYCDPEEKVLVVSGSLIRAQATTNWCLNLIMQMPELAPMRPKRSDRASSRAFDVGNCRPAQSPSFHALGIGGQIVGFRGTCIIPDDVETQQNSRTVTGREAIREAVKEFDSVLVPGGVIKYLGTPHDEDSLYSVLVEKRGYTARIWPAHFPSKKQVKGYGTKLAPYILNLVKKDPTLVGKSTMPNRFTEKDLAERRLSLGASEYALQFMLDTTLSDRDKFPLKLRDLMTMSLDPRKGPTQVVWTNDSEYRLTDLPSVGHDGDFWHRPIVPEGASYAPYNSIVAWVDNSGRGSDETALTILAELHGTLFLLYRWSSLDGYGPATLDAICAACVRYRVMELWVEENFGDGMFSSLLRPVMSRHWAKANKGKRGDDVGGTTITETKASNQMNKEKRILGTMEPVTQQHRLVVDRAVVEEDIKSVEKIDGEDGRHRYMLFHQYTRLTRDKDSLYKDDRLDSLAGACGTFADLLGVDPEMVARAVEEDAAEAELRRILGADWDDEGPPPSNRPTSMRPTPRRV